MQVCMHILMSRKWQISTPRRQIRTLAGIYSSAQSPSCILQCGNYHLISGIFHSAWIFQMRITFCISISCVFCTDQKFHAIISTTLLLNGRNRVLHLYAINQIYALVPYSLHFNTHKNMDSTRLIYTSFPFSVAVPCLTLKVLNFWKFTSYCSLKPLWSGMGEVVPARTSPTLHPPFPSTVHQLLQLAL